MLVEAIHALSVKKPPSLLGEKGKKKKKTQRKLSAKHVRKSFRNKLNTTKGFVSHCILILPTETKSLEKVI